MVNKKPNIPISADAKKQFRRKILAWYKQHARAFPWRGISDPYLVLVSECMLQQTQAERVVPYYNRFIKRWPTVRHLARARRASLLTIWSGLGYNSRPLRLLAAAKQVVRLHGGVIPADKQLLLALPGVGDYTASAILAFAWNRGISVMDTNIRRVLLSSFALPVDTPPETLHLLNTALIPRAKAALWFNALMDYGSLQLTAKKTGIRPLSRQGAFQGSTRQLRGKIIKHLITHGPQARKHLITLFGPQTPRALTALITEGILRIAPGGKLTL